MAARMFSEEQLEQLRSFPDINLPLHPGQWMPRQAEYRRLVAKPARAADAIAQGKEELHAALADLESTLARALPGDTGTVRLDDNDRLVIPKLTAEDVPAEASELRDELAGMLPFTPIASPLINWTPARASRTASPTLEAASRLAAPTSRATSWRC